MAEIINLRKARKAKARSEDAARAAENRAKFGQPKQQRDRRAAEEALEVRRLEGHKRQPPEDSGENQ